MDPVSAAGISGREAVFIVRQTTRHTSLYTYRYIDLLSAKKILVQFLERIDFGDGYAYIVIDH